MRLGGWGKPAQRYELLLVVRRGPLPPHAQGAPAPAQGAPAPAAAAPEEVEKVSTSVTNDGGTRITWVD